MYQHDIKIQKGLKNKVQIQFKNSDQKLIGVSTSTFVFSMFDALNQRLLLQKDVTLLDDGATTSTRGLGLLELVENDTIDLSTGVYQFTVAKQDADGSFEPTYANTYYGVSGTLELREDSFPRLQPSYEVKQFQSQYNHDYSALQFEYYSDKIDASPAFNGNSSLHTVAYYLNKFKGQVWVEGTQQSSPSEFTAWAEIKDSRRTYSGLGGFSGVDYFNFQGVWSSIRIRHIPAKNPVNGVNDYSENQYHGTVDKVLYRS